MPLDPRLTFSTGARRAQRGFSMIELSLVMVASLVIMGMVVAFVVGMARTAKRAQLAGQTAHEIALIATATKKHLADADAATYPVDTTVGISLATLTAEGHLPAEFARRNGAGQPAVSPLGQPYLVFARRINAGDKPTAIVAESGTAMAEKLPPLGMENEDAPIHALKQDIAERINGSYQVVSGTVMTGQRIAQGTAGAFSKDLALYLPANAAQSIAVAFVNFKDLEPGSTEIELLAPKKKIYARCDYRAVPFDPEWAPPSWGQTGMECTIPGGANNTCPWNLEGPGLHPETSRIITNCSGAAITMLPFGGAMTNGWTEEPYGLTQNPPACAPGMANCRGRKKTGSVTMNNVTIADGTCSTSKWENGIEKETLSTQWVAVGVCCQYRWDRPDPCGPKPPLWP